MASQGLGVGILGTGMSAAMHVGALRAVAGATVVAVAGSGAEKARAFADQWGIPRAGVGLAALLADPAVQLIHLCTPPHGHLEEVRACAAAGRHVLVEKPMARTVAEADAMIALAERGGITLACMFQYRFMPLAQRARAALGEGRIGRLLAADVSVKWWRGPDYYRSSAWRATRALEGGGVLINQAIHSIDLIQWLVGPVRSVQGLTRTSLHAIETEDTGLALLEYASGAVGTINTTTTAWPGFAERLELYGDGGTLLLHQGQGVLEWYTVGHQEPQIERVAAQQQAAAQDPRQISAIGHIAQFNDLVAAIAAGRAPAIDGHQGRAALAIVEAIYRSQTLQRPVALAELDA